LRVTKEKLPRPTTHLVLVQWACWPLLVLTAALARSNGAGGAIPVVVLLFGVPASVGLVLLGLCMVTDFRGTASIQSENIRRRRRPELQRGQPWLWDAATIRHLGVLIAGITVQAVTRL
jgi:hypothetical protein